MFPFLFGIWYVFPSFIRIYWVSYFYSEQYFRESLYMVVILLLNRDDDCLNLAISFLWNCVVHFVSLV